MRGPGPRKLILPGGNNHSPILVPSGVSPADSTSNDFMGGHGTEFVLPMYARVFAIDPGTETLGWSYFDLVPLEPRQKLYYSRRPNAKMRALLGVKTNPEFWSRVPDPLPAGGTQLTYADSGFIQYKAENTVNVKTGERYSWEVRASLIVQDLASQIQRRNVDIIISEFPEVYAHSAKGSAANNSGDLLKLAFQVGMIANYVVNSHFAHQFITVTPSKWKGNVPKKITKERMVERYPATAKVKDLNEMDAIGIADWLFRKSGWMCKPNEHPLNYHPKDSRRGMGVFATPEFVARRDAITRLKLKRDEEALSEAQNEANALGISLAEYIENIDTYQGDQDESDEPEPRP